MYTIDEVVRAAEIISASFPTLTSDLLSHHRRELQFAFDSLGGALRSTPTIDNSLLQSSSQEDTSNLPRNNISQNHDTRDGQGAAEIIQNDRIETERPQQDRGQDATQNRPIPNKITRRPRNTPSQDTYLRTIMNIIDQFSEKIHSFVDKRAETAVLYLDNWTDMDPFEVDIIMSLRGASTAQRLRTFLARYIFAEKYLDWAESAYKKPRVSFLRLDAKDAASKQIPHISEYLQAIDRSDNRNKRSVEQGLKFHSFEHIYKHSGAFAFLFYVHTQFRELKYESLELLAQTINKSPTWSTFAVDKTGWFSECVTLYKKSCAAYRKQRRLKRPIDSEGLEESQNKRRQEVFTSTTEIDGTGMAQRVGQNTSTSQSTVESNIQPMNELPSFQNSGIPEFALDEILFNPYFADFGFPEGEREDSSIPQNFSVPQMAC
ncbi:hypothetical protein N7478_010634 [Penicillium angulare]|uniref:uncharacterized protein n=1 Tax=Penicillium angulare TaxID=116970 RepID=UPI002540C4B3|nr:uncharacterized protein N7478_010634 [Penicillium angulare]KAJ5267826.1 hypothetical protein N7478_010634 [Penicillium angulare]